MECTGVLWRADMTTHTPTALHRRHLTHVSVLMVVIVKMGARTELGCAAVESGALTTRPNREHVVGRGSSMVGAGVTRSKHYRAIKTTVVVLA